MRTLLSILFLALLPLPSLAQVNTPESEPNNTKAQATPLVRPLEEGDTITGTGGGTLAPDYFLIQTAPAASAIYEHVLTPTPNANFRGSIRGLIVSGGVVVPGSDTVLQQTDAISPPTRVRALKWYGFGRSERLYLTVSSLGDYTLTYSRRVITPADATPVPSPGLFSCFAGPVNGTTNISAYASFFTPAFTPHADILGRAESVFAAVGAGTLYRSFDSSTPGFSSASDFPDVLVDGDSFGPVTISVTPVIDGNSAGAFNVIKANPFDISWLRFAPTATCGADWIEHGPPFPRVAAAITYDSQRARTVFLGGYGTANAILSTYEWNGDAWSSHFDPGPGYLFSAAMAFDRLRNRTVLYGGRPSTGLSQSNNLNPAKSATWLYDGVAWQEVPGAGAPGPRTRHAMAFDQARGNTVLFGGSTDAATWTWDGAAWSRHDVPGPSARFGAAMAYNPLRQQVVLFGGSAGSDETWLWDGASWTHSAATGPSGRSDHSLLFDASIGKIVLLGGSSGTEQPVWEWDGAAWTRAADPPFPATRLRTAVAAYDEARNQIFVNLVQNQYLLGTSESWTRTAGVWARACVAPGARYGHAMAFDPVRNAALSYGGQILAAVTGSPSTIAYNTDVRADTYAWSGDRWSLIAESSPPGRRWGHALTYDPLRDQAVLFGGATSISATTRPLDTWTWNGSTWTLAAAAGPSGRLWHATASDPVSGNVILFGGTAGSAAPLGDTWAWNGSAWTQLFVPGPSPRWGARMATDPVRNRLVLFGGADSNTHALADTWEWDGVSWLPIDVTNPPAARAFHSMTFDAASGTVVLIGGLSAGAFGVSGADSNIDDLSLWDWDGSAWRRRSGLSLPSPNSAGALVCDTNAGHLVWFGGWSSSSGLGGSVFTLDASGPTITQQPASLIASLDGHASFSVAGDFGQSAAFRWRRNGEPLTDGPGIAGAATVSLTVNPVEPSSEGIYDVLISTPCGPTFSAPATLTVRCRADFNADDSLNPDDLADFITAFFTVPPPPTADFNGDGQVNADDLGDFITSYFGSPC